MSDPAHLIAKIVQAGEYLDRQPVPWIKCPTVFLHRDFFKLIKGKPMFTQKHYVALADLIHKRRLSIRTEFPKLEPNASDRIDELNTMVLALSVVFEQDNPKFKKFTFIEACNRDLKETV